MYVVICIKRYNGRILLGLIFACFVLCTANLAYGQFPAGSIGGQCSLCGRFVWGSYDSHDCPNAQSESQSEQENYSAPAQGDYSQPSRRPVVRIEPTSQFERQKELSRQSNNQGVDYLNRGDTAAAIRFFQQALEHWSDNSEAIANLQTANERLANQLRRALEQQAQEAAWARQIEEHNRQVMAAVTQQFRQAEDKRKREESNRKVQATKNRIDGILQGLSADFDNRSGAATGAPDPDLDFKPVIEQDSAPHSDPMVVDARHATGPKPLPAASHPNASRNTKKASRNPRTTVLLDALEAGLGDWEVSVAHLKNIIQKNPADTAARDAYHFTIGFSSGLNEREQRFPADRNIYSIPDDPMLGPNGAARAAVDDAVHAAQRKDFEAAYRAFKIAHQADPKNGAIRDEMNLCEGLAAAQVVEPAPLSRDELVTLLIEGIESEILEGIESELREGDESELPARPKE